MRHRPRTALVAVLVAVCFCAVRTEPRDGPTPSVPPLVPRPRLVLFVSVDQMRFDLLTRFEALFHGGLRRLLDRGAVFVNARYRHANTETGPGHAVLLSGLNASHSGIVANDWYDPLTRTVVNVVDDPAQASVGGTGRGASPVNFIGFTVGDLLKRTWPDARVVSVSLKDRAAVLMGGRRADAAYWFETRVGRFVSSTYYMRALPGWLASWDGERHADRLHGRTWTRLLADASVYERLAGPDAQAGEWDGVDVVFPHALHGRPPEEAFYTGVRRTPFADELTLDVALRALDAHGLGRLASTDLLAVSFSAGDIIGHAYGPDSQEMMDDILRLDLVLQTLFDAAERAARGPLLVVLSADHGSMPLVEVLQRRGIGARRVRPEALEAAVARALAARFPGSTGLVARFDPPNFYLDLEAARRQGLGRSEVEATAAEGALSTGIVERVYTHAALLGDPPADDPEFALFRHAFFEPRSPHLTVRLKEYVNVDDRPGGTTHGTYHDYDRHVPIVFMGAGVRPGRYAEPCGPEDIAPTLAGLLGLAYPMQDAQRLLTEMIAR